MASSPSTCGLKRAQPEIHTPFVSDAQLVNQFESNIRAFNKNEEMSNALQSKTNTKLLTIPKGPNLLTAQRALKRQKKPDVEFEEVAQQEESQAEQPEEKPKEDLSVIDQILSYINSSNKEDLKKLHGIGEKRATWILEIREDDLVPFKRVEDLKILDIGPKLFKKLAKKFERNI